MVRPNVVIHNLAKKAAELTRRGDEKAKVACDAAYRRPARNVTCVHVSSPEVVGPNSMSGYGFRGSWAWKKSDSGWGIGGNLLLSLQGSLRPVTIPTSSDKELWSSSELHSKKHYAPGFGSRDPSKKLRADDGPSSRASASASTRKGEYAISFDFLSITLLSDDVKTCALLHRKIHLAGTDVLLGMISMRTPTCALLHRNIHLAGNLSFLEQMFRWE
ncbi:hypothetical protein YC2023_018705 [Brassica napus]